MTVQQVLEARHAKASQKRFTGDSVTGFGDIDACKPAVGRGAPIQATPGEARSFERGYTDCERGLPAIEVELASYRAGYALAMKHEQIAEDARGEDLWLARGGEA